MPIKKPIYLDNQATTPMDPLVLEAMMPYFTEKFGNPHSGGHAYGWEAEAGIDRARAQIATLINAADAPSEIVFMSGATEANNLAIKSVMQRYGSDRPHMVTAATEHKCVLETMKYCQQSRFDLTVLPVDAEGRIDLQQLSAAVSEKTAIVSLMAVNNEIGTIHDLKAIAEISHRAGALFHTDAAQAFGKIPLDVQDIGIDLMSISGHKIYGPKGIGALYVKTGIKLGPQMHGGAQEQGVRAGTLAPALCVGLGKAAKLAQDQMDQDAEKAGSLSTMLFSGLKAVYPAVNLNGSVHHRWSGNLNIEFPGVQNDLLLASLRGIALSSGSACASGSGGGSYVLKALGLSEQQAKSSLRLGIGRFTTEADINQALTIFDHALTKMGKSL